MSKKRRKSSREKIQKHRAFRRGFKIPNFGLYEKDKFMWTGLRESTDMKKEWETE